jgi:hypothetical protein
MISLYMFVEVTMHDRNYKWKSLNKVIKIKDMDGLHLANVIHLLNFNRIPKLEKRLKNSNLVQYQIETLQIQLEETKRILFNMIKEFEFRNLDNSLIRNAPHPFKDSDGLLKKWNYDTNSLDIVSSAKRFILDDKD